MDINPRLYVFAIIHSQCCPEELLKIIIQFTRLPDIYVGRAHMSLKNLITLSTKNAMLLLESDPVFNAPNATLSVSTYPHSTTPSLNTNVLDLRGDRFDFVVHILQANRLPSRYSYKVFSQYAIKWSDEVHNTAITAGTDPIFNFKKRFAYASLTQKHATWFATDVLWFEVIGYPINSTNPNKCDLCSPSRHFLKSPTSCSKRYYLGTCHLCLSHILHMQYRCGTIPLICDDPRYEPATLRVCSYPVDVSGRPFPDPPSNTVSVSSIMGKRIDFVVHVMSAHNLPAWCCDRVRCSFAFRWKEGIIHKSPEVSGTNPVFKFQKRFASSILTPDLARMFMTNFLYFEVVAMN